MHGAVIVHKVDAQSINVKMELIYKRYRLNHTSSTARIRTVNLVVKHTVTMSKCCTANIYSYNFCCIFFYQLSSKNMLINQKEITEEQMS